MSHHQWYYGHADQQHGPVDEATLRGKIASGEVTPGTLVWREGMADWTLLASVGELQAPGDPYAAGAASMSPGPYGGPVAPPTSGLAIASMVCGIVSLMLCYLGFLTGIPAVICGHMALGKIRSAPYFVAGRDMAIAGLITGYLAIAVAVAAIGFLVFAVVSGNA